MSNTLQHDNIVQDQNLEELANKTKIAAIGAANSNVADYLLETSLRGILPAGKMNEQNLRAVYSLIQEMSAKNLIEGMLYCQMIACHTHAMELFRQGSDTYDYTRAQKYLGLADRFMRTYTKSLETLERYKRGGKQHVIVENVVVNSGGQAIVGNIKSGQGGV